MRNQWLKSLALIVSVLSTLNLSAQCCNYTLEMTDSYGDGWNGGANISIIVDGVTVVSSEGVNLCACTSNTSETITFNVCQGETIEWTYVDGTSYDYENGFSIIDPDGNVIASDSDPTNGPTAGTFSAGTGNCPPTCDDGIQNGDETGVDCGGTSCVPCSCFNGVQDGNETAIDYGGDCGDCNNGIMDGAETGIDCGGPYCIPCNTNSTTYNSTNCCNNTAIATVYPTNCDQIGTSVYNNNSPIIDFQSSNTSGCLPSPAPSGCGAVTGTGSWVQVDLADGVNYVQLSFQGGSAANGNTTTYHSFYQGTDCSNLNFIECAVGADFASGIIYPFETSVSGLDPNQDLWIYTWNSGNKAYSLDYQIVGAQVASNSTCATGSTALGEACNLGAQGASFTAPSSALGAGACAGGTWYSNENTTFYSFTADDNTGSLEIQNIICNDGTIGESQFGVWTSCSAIGTYGADFLGCGVGTSPLSLSPLVPGQTYYIAADGQAGDNCAWEFTGTGIILPIELGEFTAYHNGHEVELEWTTITELNNDHFTVQRTLDGKTFEDIALVDGAGTSSQELYYSYTDRQPYQGISYYRIKQTDFDGKFEYSELISVRSGEKGLILVATYNLLGQKVGLDYEGVVIDLYSDGTTNKRYQQHSK